MLVVACKGYYVFDNFIEDLDEHLEIKKGYELVKQKHLPFKMDLNDEEYILMVVEAYDEACSFLLNILKKDLLEGDYEYIQDIRSSYERNLKLIDEALREVIGDE
jgi:hypothetical protein